MSSRIHRFATAAEEFCAWCEQEKQDAVSEALTAMRVLSKIYSLALDLRIPSNIEFGLDGECTDDKTWEAVFVRHGALPFRYYNFIFNPLIEPAEEPVVGDLRDDLADIHRDLICGLSLYRCGHLTNAEWQWRHSFKAHWGQHASWAMQALHSWFSEQDDL